MGHHREWIRSNSMGAKAHAHEHYTLCAAIELLASFDQLNCPQLLGVELLMRRVMLIESAYEIGKNGRADFYHSEEVMGFLSRPSGAVISSTLEAEATERLKTRAEISKQLHKAKEATGPGHRPKPPKAE